MTRIAAPGGTDGDGVLLVNPGGPAESGNQILPLLYPNLPAPVRDAIDVVSFDPRGTGVERPAPVRDRPRRGDQRVPPVPARPGCPAPGDPGLRRHPSGRAGPPPPPSPRHVDTVDTARDMDRIRQALGVSTVSFYGLSYGTVLGTAYASLFPHRVRAMVLDGAVDLYAPLATQAVRGGARRRASP